MSRTAAIAIAKCSHRSQDIRQQIEQRMRDALSSRDPAYEGILWADEAILRGDLGDEDDAEADQENGKCSDFSELQNSSYEFFLNFVSFFLNVDAHVCSADGDQRPQSSSAGSNAERSVAAGVKVRRYSHSMNHVTQSLSRDELPRQPEPDKEIDFESNETLDGPEIEHEQGASAVMPESLPSSTLASASAAVAHDAPVPIDAPINAPMDVDDSVSVAPRPAEEAMAEVDSGVAPGVQSTVHELSKHEVAASV